MKIDTYNFLGDRFSLISDINQLIKIDYIDTVTPRYNEVPRYRKMFVVAGSSL